MQHGNAPKFDIRYAVYTRKHQPIINRYEYCNEGNEFYEFKVTKRNAGLFIDTYLGSVVLGFYLVVANGLGRAINNSIYKTLISTQRFYNFRVFCGIEVYDRKLSIWFIDALYL